MSDQHPDNGAAALRVSDHELNAWLDGELVEPESSQVAAAMVASPELAARVCALRTLKSLLNLAYDPDSLPQAAMPARHANGTGSRD